MAAEKSEHRYIWSRFQMPPEVNTNTLSIPSLQLYRQDPATGRVYMSLAADSTCHVVSAHNGYETFMLGPIEPEPLPPIVERAQCTFPEFTQGPWGDQVNIDEGTMIMRDPKNDFSTQTIRCLLQGQDDRFPVHSISQW